MKFDVWNLKEDISKYNKYLENCIDTTVYHMSEYLLAEETAEETGIRVLLLEEDEKFAMIPSVVRKLNSISYLSLDLQDNVYDMITPHEYGGIISNSKESGIRYKLLKCIEKYCAENSIIFSFVRINPYLKELPEIYERAGFDLICNKSHVWVDLSLSDEMIVKTYKPRVRTAVRKAEKEGLRFEIAQINTTNINVFQSMYCKSMDYLNAKSFLYFNEEYFSRLLQCDFSRLVFVRDVDDKVIAAAIMLLEKDIIYYHLSCFDRTYSSKQPVNYLIHSMIKFGKKEGCKVFHLGGGGASLMFFKAGFSMQQINYFTAVRIYDTSKYEEVCNMWKLKFTEYDGVQFYPLYRYNE